MDGPSLEGQRVAGLIAQWLEQAGIPAVASGSHVAVAEGDFDCIPRHREVAADVYDRFVASLLKPQLIAIAKTRLEAGSMTLLREPDLWVIEAPRGARVLGPAGPVADIHASRTYVPAAANVALRATSGVREKITGNFLLVDSDWHYATRCIRAAARWQLAQERRLAATWRELPAAVHPSVADAMVHSSARLRNERTIAYGHPVVLLAPGGLRIRLDPLWQHGSELELDFAIAGSQGRLSGSLLIGEDLRARDSWRRLTAGASTASRLLPLRIRSGDQAFAVAAWKLALQAAAELMCVRYSEPARTRRREEPASSAVPYARPKSLESRRFRRRPSWLAETLTPTPATARVIGSYVVGHLRHLTSGEASDEAHRNAQAVGMVIPPGCTWVRPHARGLPAGAPLEFHWNTHQLTSIDASGWQGS